MAVMVAGDAIAGPARYVPPVRSHFETRPYDTRSYETLTPSEATSKIGRYDATSNSYVYKDAVLIKASAATPMLIAALRNPMPSRPAVSLFMEAGGDRTRVMDEVPSAVDMPTSLNSIRQLMAGLKGRTLIVVGHFEQGYLAYRGSGPDAPRIKIETLDKLAEQYGVLLHFLSCRAGSQLAVTGSASDIYTPQVISRIKAALRATLFGDFLAGLGGGGAMLVVNSGVQIGDYFRVVYEQEQSTKDTVVVGRSYVPAPTMPQSASVTVESGGAGGGLAAVGMIFMFLFGLLALINAAGSSMSDERRPSPQAATSSRIWPQLEGVQLVTFSIEEAGVVTRAYMNVSHPLNGQVTKVIEAASSRQISAEHGAAVLRLLLPKMQKMESNSFG